MSDPLTIKKTARAIKAAFRKKITGDTVSHAEAKRRSEICAQCDHCVPGETPKQKAALVLSGGSHVCDQCDCGIALLVVTKNDLLERSSGPYPDYCWLPKK